MAFGRVLALVLSVLMLSCPVMAEETAFSAGDLTLTTISESYSGGYQINVVLGFDVEDGLAALAGEQAQAAAALLEMSQVHLSFYDDFGTARVRGSVLLDGAELVSGDMLIMEDGSVQLVTSLTGNMAFTLPAGTVTPEGIVLPGANAQAEYEDMTAFERLKVTTPNMVSTEINLLLGWVSGTQMETGELYTFDYETYIDATDARDAVATRMIGKIRSTDLLEFVWNIVTHIRDKEHDFQAALAMCIGKMGLTRYEGRRIIDSLFPDEIVDPETYYIQPSESIPDNPALFMYDDLRYLLCKLDMSLMNAWGDNTLDTHSSMVVSYDDYGEMVGLDMELQPVSKVYPFEGDLTYSVKTDDDWQRMHTAHGELQLYNDQRVIGDLDMKLGQDVGGIKDSHFNGQIDLVNRADGTAAGIGVASSLRYALTPDEQGESIEGSASLLMNDSGESIPLIGAQLSAVSSLTELGLTLTGAADLTAAGMQVLRLTAGVDCVEYEDEPFEGGQAVDLAGELTQEQLDAIQSAVASQAAGMALRFAFKPAVLQQLLILTGGLGL